MKFQFITKIENKYWHIVYFALIIGLIIGFSASYLKHRSKPTPQKAQPTTIVPTITLNIQNQDTAPSISDSQFRLIIEKLNINAPIIANVDGSNETAYDLALQNGVAQFVNTALPDQIGNMVIFGHSSFYANQPGNYKMVFSTLNKLQAGDQIEIHYQNRKYLYQVDSLKIVLPSDVDILKPTTNQQLTLLTCWPIYSTAKRLVVVAQRVN